MTFDGKLPFPVLWTPADLKMASTSKVDVLRAATDAVLFPTHKTKNKTKDREERAKQKLEKRKTRCVARQKRKELEEALGDAAPPKQVPRTIENTREPDETMVDPEDEEVKFDEATDEMASYFRKEREPKVLITSSENPHPKTIRFCREMNKVIPNSTYRFRCKSGVKKLCTAATDRGFTDIMIINEDRRMPNALLLIHLPKGPTAYFRLTNVRFRKTIKNCGELTSHRPELILNNFNTRLGHVTARMLASIFHFDPQFKGRSVVTFHNQRDFIFFRFHRYEFRNEKKVGLQELGPRFTLKLKSLQQGSFDSKFGEYEWILKRHEMETSRRRFFL